jgi:glutaminyl-tRNA synthetase
LRVPADSKSGTAGADGYKVKGNLHWVSVAEACLPKCASTIVCSPFRLTGARREGDPEGVERDFRDDINPDSMRVIQAWLEPSLKAVEAEERFQFERHGYFVADRVDSQEGAPVFNRTVTLRDSWSARPGQRK